MRASRTDIIINQSQEGGMVLEEFGRGVVHAGRNVGEGSSLGSVSERRNLLPLASASGTDPGSRIAFLLTTNPSVPSPVGFCAAQHLSLHLGLPTK